MNAETLGKVCAQVYRRFPELAGKTPQVQERPGEQFLLIFRGKAQAADGRAIAQTVRVVVTAAGKITKVSSSK
jgi:hypothetical protein